eukprot:jgi/Mesen1/7476/ME000039S06693
MQVEFGDPKIRASLRKEVIANLLQQHSDTFQPNSVAYDGESTLYSIQKVCAGTQRFKVLKTAPTGEGEERGKQHEAEPPGSSKREAAHSSEVKFLFHS